MIDFHFLIPLLFSNCAVFFLIITGLTFLDMNIMKFYSFKLISYINLIHYFFIKTIQHNLISMKNIQQTYQRYKNTK